MTRRLLALLGAVAFVITLALTFPGARTAFAGTGNQWCDDQARCANGWNNGPAVKDYAYPAVNNDFTVIGDYNECNGGFTTSTCPGNGVPSGLPIVMFQYSSGSGSYNGTCIEDNGNSQTDAKASLGASCSGTGGWGSNFVQFTSNNCGMQSYDVFYDIHWKGYLIWDSTHLGNQAYLNGGSGNCLTALPPA